MVRMVPWAALGATVGAMVTTAGMGVVAVTTAMVAAPWARRAIITTGTDLAPDKATRAAIRAKGTIATTATTVTAEIGTN